MGNVSVSLLERLSACRLGSIARSPWSRGADTVGALVGQWYAGRTEGAGVGVVGELGGQQRLPDLDDGSSVTWSLEKGGYNRVRGIHCPSYGSTRHILAK